MIIGALRIKNEARWIERVLSSLRPICEELVVLMTAQCWYSTDLR